MSDNEWLIGTLTFQELVEHQARLHQASERAAERSRQLSSHLFECQAIAEERRWRRDHPHN